MPFIYKCHYMLGGVRLETILQTVKKTDALYQEKNYGNFLAFEPVTLVPFEPHLIDYNLLKSVNSIFTLAVHSPKL